MTTQNSVADLVRKCFTAYQEKDRQAIEVIMSPDLTFTSPYDDHIDRAEYFRRCWANADRIHRFDIQHLFVDGNDAFVLYEVTLQTGVKFKNTEFFRTDGKQIKSVEVYFGSLPIGKRD